MRSSVISRDLLEYKKNPPRGHSESTITVSNARCLEAAVHSCQYLQHLYPMQIVRLQNSGLSKGPKQHFTEASTEIAYVFNGKKFAEETQAKECESNSAQVFSYSSTPFQ